MTLTSDKMICESDLFFIFYKFYGQQLLRLPWITMPRSLSRPMANTYRSINIFSVYIWHARLARPSFFHQCIAVGQAFSIFRHVHIAVIHTQRHCLLIMKRCRIVDVIVFVLSNVVKSSNLVY